MLNRIKKIKRDIDKNAPYLLKQLYFTVGLAILSGIANLIAPELGVGIYLVALWLTRLSGGASEVLGRAPWAPVLHLLLGHSESPAWPPSHSDNRKVNIPPPPGLQSGQRGSGAASGAPPRLGQPARG